MKQINYDLNPSPGAPIEESPPPTVQFDSGSRKFPWGILLAVIFFISALIAAAYFYFQTIEYTINSYDECVAAGNPSEESYPATS